MDQVLKKAGRIPEQILGKVSIAVSGCPGGFAWAVPRAGIREREYSQVFQCVSSSSSLFCKASLSVVAVGTGMSDTFWCVCAWSCCFCIG